MTPEERAILLAIDSSPHRSGRIYPQDGRPGMHHAQRMRPTVVALISGVLLALPILAFRLWRGPY